MESKQTDNDVELEKQDTKKSETEDVLCSTLLVGTRFTSTAGAKIEDGSVQISSVLYRVEVAETDELTAGLLASAGSTLPAGGKLSAGLPPAGSLSAEGLPVDIPSAEERKRNTYATRYCRTAENQYASLDPDQQNQRKKDPEQHGNTLINEFQFCLTSISAVACENK
ncbi:hypothetical protein Tco_0991126 [Tanacetum coccineum]|uniref:Uncharacterized protein n=1 Tax=Tanacetum coccineum TaxID=301880 RepID=A0ABQ5EYR8_9ASTR